MKSGTKKVLVILGMVIALPVSIGAYKTAAKEWGWGAGIISVILALAKRMVPKKRVVLIDINQHTCGCYLR